MCLNSMPSSLDGMPMSDATDMNQAASTQAGKRPWS